MKFNESLCLYSLASFSFSFDCFIEFPEKTSIPKFPLILNNLAQVTGKSLTEKAVVTPPV